MRRNQSFRPPLSNTAVYFQHFTSCACLIAVLPSLTSGFLLPAPLPTDIAILDRQDRVALRHSVSCPRHCKPHTPRFPAWPTPFTPGTDIAILDRQDRVAWRGVEMASHSPAPREKHTLTPLSGGRLLMFGGT